MILLERSISTHPKTRTSVQSVRGRSNGINQRPGFTLIELLLYIGVSTIVILVISNFMIDVSRAANRNRASLELQANARFVTSQITQDVRTADTVTLEGCGSTCTTLVVGLNRYCAQNDAVIVTSSGNCSGGTELTNDKVKVTDPNLFFAETNGTFTMDLTLEPTVASTPTVPAHHIVTTLVPRQTIYVP